MTKFRILTLNNISHQALLRFTPDRYTVGKHVEHPDAILVRSHDMHGMTIPPTVRRSVVPAPAPTTFRWPQCPIAACRCLTRPAPTRMQCESSCSPHSLIGRAIWFQHCGSSPGPHDADFEAHVEEGKKQFAGIELPHRTLGIIGLGAIGALVADTALKLGMKVVGYDPEITVDAAWRLQSAVRKRSRSTKC